MAHVTAKRLYVGLGLSLHDPAVALVDHHGQIIFAQATERHLQNKRAWNSVPDDIEWIDALLERYLGDAEEIVVATSWSDRSLRRVPWLVRGLDAHYSARSLRKHPDESVQIARDFVHHATLQVLHRAAPSLRTSALNLDFRAWQRGVPVRRVGLDHHACHAATALYTAPFDDCAVAVIDGLGEGRSTALYRAHQGQLTPLGPTGINLASLGYFYAYACIACGFQPIRGEEWKVMGLAALGERDDELYALLDGMLTVRGLQLRRSRDFERRLGRLLALAPTPGSDPSVSANLAWCAQHIFVERTVQLLTNLHDATGQTRLALGGGCALNSACNGQIVGRTGFDTLHVYSAPGDDGNAIGAALLAWQGDHGRPPPCGQQAAYLGERLDPLSLRRLCDSGALHTERLSEARIIERSAERLANGGLVGFAHGRAEFGPRALGHRSILADPRGAGTKDRINKKVKFRERFRPFAPAVLHERGPDWFLDYQDSPYMERALRFRPEVQARVPAVVHADGTGRLQSVHRAESPRFHALIERFESMTGVPMLLNTSLNVMGKPIVHSVQDAVAVFCTTGLDAMVLDDVWVEKRG